MLNLRWPQAAAERKAQEVKSPGGRQTGNLKLPSADECENITCLRPWQFHTLASSFLNLLGRILLPSLALAPEARGWWLFTPDVTGVPWCAAHGWQANADPTGGGAQYSSF